MAHGRFSGLRWESVEEVSESNASKAAAERAAPAKEDTVDLSAYAEHPLVKLLRRTGVPRHPDHSATPREEAEFLLQAASEVEHQFIVQYLYALFSLDFAEGGEIAEQSSTHLLQIAKEEMGHILTVQNALLLIGAEPYLVRERTPPADPQPFPLMLEPAGLPFVSRFLVAESPVDAELPDDLGDLKKRIEHVGALYAMIYWLFQDSDAPQEPWMLPPIMLPSGQHLRPGDYNADTARVANLLNTASDWIASGGIHVLPALATPLGNPAEMADAARRALFDVALQGEGPTDAGDDAPEETSHFHRLLGLYMRIRDAGQGLKLALDVPVDPHTRRAGETDPEQEPGLITDNSALLHARFFDLRYSILMLEIFLSVKIPRTKLADGVPVRRTLARRAITVEMRRGIGPLGFRLVTLPLKESQNGVAPPFAGAPFGLPPDLFPDNERTGWESLLRLIDESRTLIDGAGGHLSAEMQALRPLDETHRAFVVARIAEFA